MPELDELGAALNDFWDVGGSNRPQMAGRLAPVQRVFRL